MKLEFLKVYDVTELIREEKDRLISYGDVEYTEVYVAMDVLDTHVFRILEGYNEEFEEENGVFLVEREQISKLSIAEKLLEMSGYSKDVFSRDEAETIISQHKPKKVLLATLLVDDENGLENYEVKEFFSLEEAKKMVEGGYGIAVL